MKIPYGDVILFVLALPMTILVKFVSFAAALVRLRPAIAPAMPCGTCGADIPLVGMWRCACGYTYQGHLLRFCPVCNAFPRMIRCYRCGATKTVRL